MKACTLIASLLNEEDGDLGELWFVEQNENEARGLSLDVRI